MRLFVGGVQFLVGVNANDNVFAASWSSNFASFDARIVLDGSTFEFRDGPARTGLSRYSDESGSPSDRAPGVSALRASDGGFFSSLIAPLSVPSRANGNPVSSQSVRGIATASLLLALDIVYQYRGEWAATAEAQSSSAPSNHDASTVGAGTTDFPVVSASFQPVADSDTPVAPEILKAGPEAGVKIELGPDPIAINFNAPANGDTDSIAAVQGSPAAIATATDAPPPAAAPGSVPHETLVLHSIAGNALLIGGAGNDILINDGRYGILIGGAGDDILDASKSTGPNILIGDSLNPRLIQIIDGILEHQPATDQAPPSTIANPAGSSQDPGAGAPANEAPPASVAAKQLPPAPVESPPPPVPPVASTKPASGPISAAADPTNPELPAVDDPLPIAPVAPIVHVDAAPVSEPSVAAAPISGPDPEHQHVAVDPVIPNADGLAPSGLVTLAAMLPAPSAENPVDDTGPAISLVPPALDTHPVSASATPASDAPPAALPPADPAIDTHPAVTAAVSASTAPDIGTIEAALNHLLGTSQPDIVLLSEVVESPSGNSGSSSPVDTSSHSDSTQPVLVLAVSGNSGPGGSGGSSGSGNGGNSSGPDGNDIIIGGKGNDIIVGGGGDDILTGGLGNDVFIFMHGSGHDVITDFSHDGGNHDMLYFEHGLFADFTDFEAHEHDFGDHVVITISSHDDITLLNATKMSLSSHDSFAFL